MSPSSRVGNRFREHGFGDRPVLLGFSLTQHCNLRCPHCIRDDVLTVQSLPADVVFKACDDALALFGDVTASFTGGEPTIHPQWNSIIRGMKERGIPYRLVTNGWHMRRLMPGFDIAPPAYVRVSLSGATEATHDMDRGRDSFRRVLKAVALLTSRQIPTALSIVIDRRDRHQVREAADLAENLGCLRMHFILPQPVPGSVLRDSDLAPDDWRAVQDEIGEIAREPHRLTAIQLDYGAPAEPGNEEIVCDTMSLNRLYIDAHGRMSLCCQLSEYGVAETDIVADLNVTPFRDAWAQYLEAMTRLRAMADPSKFTGAIAAFPCMRCAKALGKLDWLGDMTSGPWKTLAACG